MIEILTNSPIGCLVVHLNAQMNDQVSQELIDALALAEELIARRKQVSLVVDFTGFADSRDVAVSRIDSKFVYGDFNQIHRTAIVGSQKWIEWFTRLVGPFMPDEGKYFQEGDPEAACEWACEGNKYGSDSKKASDGIDSCKIRRPQ